MSEHQLEIFGATFGEVGAAAVRYAVVHYTALNVARSSVLAQLALPMVAVSQKDLRTCLRQLLQLSPESDDE